MYLALGQDCTSVPFSCSADMASTWCLVPRYAFCPHSWSNPFEEPVSWHAVRIWEGGEPVTFFGIHGCTIGGSQSVGKCLPTTSGEMYPKSEIRTLNVSMVMTLCLSVPSFCPHSWSNPFEEPVSWHAVRIWEGGEPVTFFGIHGCTIGGSQSVGKCASCRSRTGLSCNAQSTWFRFCIWSGSAPRREPGHNAV